MMRQCDGAVCALKVAQDLEQSNADARTIHQTVLDAERCAAASQCPDSSYCVIACAGLLGRLDIK